ncbi:response regulator [Aquabacterium sp.]|uniref:response regulator n=1 Tax=Aquabacterium sp. TaxID=1872578 RepID=UPI003782D621
MIRLFLVDDHALVRDGLRAMVERAGHIVVGESGTLEQALTGVVASSPDVVLVDLNLGERSGLELLVELQRRRVTARAVVITMSERAADVAAALRHGACGYVLKGSRAPVLMAAIEAAQRGERFLGLTEADLALQGMAAASAGPAPLTPRERQVLALAAHGRTSAAIGSALHLSPKTVDSYRHRAMQKLSLADTAAIVRWAIREGLMALDAE